MKVLTRSKTNRVIAGVCGGLGDYFNIDPVVIRILWVLFSLLGGSGIFAYIIAWVVIPEAGAKKALWQEWTEDKPKSKRVLAETNSNTRKIIGLFLLFLGAVFLLNNLGLISWSWPYTFSASLIIIGLVIIISGRRRD
ncbi:MAG: PspC domain-containing protein [Candidatus Nanoarchaeia archaeon]|jgi:phage shock protein PspC (stress-responsive transcriptional regulator)